MDGMDLAYQITEMSSIGVLILTGRGHTVDRVMGLELGGDDYVVKPFEARELVARVRRILRRRASTPGVAPQARERSAKPQDHQDGLWCRLPVFGCGDLVVIETWVRTNPRTCASHLVRARRMPQSLSQRGSDEATRWGSRGCVVHRPQRAVQRRQCDSLQKLNLIGNELQPQALPARSTLTPTLSKGHAWPLRGPWRERDQVGSLSRVLVGERVGGEAGLSSRMRRACVAVLACKPGRALQVRVRVAPPTG